MNRRRWVVRTALIALLASTFSCRAASQGQVALVIDLTNPLGSDGLPVLKGVFRTVAASMSRGDSLSVYFLDSSSPRPRFVWAGSSPGRAEEANPLFEGSAVVAARFDAEFIAPLDSLAAVAAASSDSSRSTRLLEGLWMLSAFTPFGHALGARRCFVVSDFLENSPELSFYTNPVVSFFSPDGRLRFPQWRARLEGVEVRGIMLLRTHDTQLQGPHLVSEWSRYIEACGGTIEMQMETLP